MTSILYLTSYIPPVISNTIGKTQKLHHVSLNNVSTQLEKIVKDDIKTSYTFIAPDTTYVNIIHVNELIKHLDVSIDLIGNHFIDNVLDVDCGIVIKTQSLLSFSSYVKLNGKNFDNINEFSKELSSYAYLSKFVIAVKNGFNKLNYNATYATTHICDKCRESFLSSPVFTLANMSEKDFIDYHGFIDKNRDATIAVALMIKDEESKIEETLDCYKNHTIFPEIYILDTGSTDQTLTIVKNWSSKNPLTKMIIEEQSFIDFSSSRNVLLTRIYKESPCEFIISVDCNDELREQKKCVEMLARYYHCPTFFIDQVWKSAGSDPITFTNIRIIKNDGFYLWKYRVHEVLAYKLGDSPIIVRLPKEIHLYQYRDPQYELMKSARYRRDLVYLLEDHALYPDDKRIAYYVSQTYFFCQDHSNAIIFSKKRIKMNKEDELDEECYQCILRIIKSKHALRAEKHNIKKWLWYAWDYFASQKKKDIEPLLQIIEYYEKDDLDTALHLLCLACDTPKPNFNLPIRHELYEFERYRKLAEVYYKKRNFNKVYEWYSEILKHDALPEQKKGIEHLLSQYYPSYHKKDKPIVAIYGGFYYDRKWNGKMFYEKTIALGGTETMVIKLAHLLKNNYHVYVFVNTDDQIEYDGVTYLKVEAYQEFVAINKIKHLISSRDASVVLSYPENVENSYLWLHDLTHANGTLQHIEKFDHIITLTPFHKKFYEGFIDSSLPDKKIKQKIKNKITIVPNIGCILNKLQTPKQLKTYKISSNRFIYSSCPTRGLDRVIKDFIECKKIVKDAELYVYSDFNNDYVKRVMGENASALLHLIQHTDGIVYRGRLPEEDFLAECRMANFWYYPTTFEETFCITAVQMMSNGVIPIYSEIGALPYIVADAGVKCNSSDTLYSIIQTMNDDKRNLLMKKGVERSKMYTEVEIKRQWLTNLNEVEMRRRNKEIKK